MSLNANNFYIHLWRYLTNKSDYYIEWRHWIVNDKVIFKSSTLRDGLREREGTATDLDAETTKLLDRIDDFLEERKKITRALPFFQKILADDYTIDSITSEMNFKLKVRDTVVFGDFKDVTDETDTGENVKPMVRRFYPGKGY